MKFQEIKELLDKTAYRKMVKGFLDKNEVTKENIIYYFSFRIKSIADPEVCEMIPISNYVPSSRLKRSFSTYNRYKNYHSVVNRINDEITDFIIDYKLPDEPSDEEKELYSVISVIAPLITKWH